VDLIFIIVKNTYISLKKILTMMVPEKFPMVSDIKVIDDSNPYGNHDNFRIYLGVKYNDLYGAYNENDISSDIRNYVRQISKYVTGSDNTTISVGFFDPTLMPGTD
jgi:hypothetical protein